MDDNTLPGRHWLADGVDPADRWWAPTEHMTAVVGDGFDRFIPPARGRHAKEDTVAEPLSEDEARAIVDRVAAAVTVPEQDTDEGWARLAGVLGVDAQAVA